MTTKASVIIPTFNGGDLLLEVCKKLLVQDYKDSWEIIIIDSESSDDSINQIQELFRASFRAIRSWHEQQQQRPPTASTPFRE